MAGFYPGIPAATLPLTGNEIAAFDTQLTGGANPQTEVISLDQIATYAGGSLPMQASRFYGLPENSTPTTLLTVTGTLYAYPVYLANPPVIKTISLDTTTGQTGGAAHIGIYADNGAGYPGLLVSGSDSGALIATSGAGVQSNTVNLNINSGWYWLASIFTASATFPTVAAAAVAYTMRLNALLGSDTAAHFFAASAEAATGISVAATYGALASINSGVFPTGAALVQNADVPLIALGT